MGTGYDLARRCVLHEMVEMPLSFLPQRLRRDSERGRQERRTGPGEAPMRLSSLASPAPRRGAWMRLAWQGCRAGAGREEVGEWMKPAVCRTAVLRGLAGSNPALSTK